MEPNTQGDTPSNGDLSTGAGSAGSTHTGTANAGSTNIGGRSGDQSFASIVSDKAGGALSAVKEKASNLPGMLADTLDRGAEALRQSPNPSGAMIGGGTAALASDSSVAQAKDTLAKSMQSSADWLRDANLDKVREGIEQQVKERPARSLFIALGVGYVLGKAIRR